MFGVTDFCEFMVLGFGLAGLVFYPLAAALAIKKALTDC